MDWRKKKGQASFLFALPLKTWTLETVTKRNNENHWILVLPTMFFLIHCKETVVATNFCILSTRLSRNLYRFYSTFFSPAHYFGISSLLFLKCDRSLMSHINFLSFLMGDLTFKMRISHFSFSQMVNGFFLWITKNLL